MENKCIPCEDVGTLIELLKSIPDDANLRVNGKKARFYDDANTWTVYLESVEDEPYYPYPF